MSMTQDLSDWTNTYYISPQPKMLTRYIKHLHKQGHLHGQPEASPEAEHPISLDFWHPNDWPTIIFTAHLFASHP